LVDKMVHQMVQRTVDLMVVSSAERKDEMMADMMVHM